MGRVTAQVIQALYPVSWLPRFNLWHSGLLPYPALLSCQLFILVAMGKQLLDSMYNRWTSPAWPKINITKLGLIYFSVALLRLCLSLVVDTSSELLGSTLPNIFHLILAIGVTATGLLRNQAEFESFKYFFYPIALLAGFTAYFALSKFIESPAIAALWVAVSLAVVLSACEQVMTHRDEWKPTLAEWLGDLKYMLWIQGILPKAMAFLSLTFLVSFSTENPLVADSIWPHHLPLFVQFILLLLVIDFFRYWLHRASHTYPALWRLHAIHHSSTKLNLINVGKFHPVEKALQFVLDTLPFLLIGVSQQVLALYFLFYAINGFFQHCNIDVRLGWLNYIISGPELHRWHHSRKKQESDHNFGNNLIIWDLFFKTFYLPKRRNIKQLGLLNPNYPQSFTQQMFAPLHKNLDKKNDNDIEI